MPYRPERERIEELLQKFETSIQAAFLAAIDELRGNVDVKALIRALEAGDIQAAIDACHVNDAAFYQLRRAIEAAYIEAGVDAVKALPVVTDWRGAIVGVRFDPSYPRAAEWAARHGAELVTWIGDDARAAIRDVVEKSLMEGTNPRSAAVQVAGRVNRVTGRREGGIVGLTRQQTAFVTAARDELVSGDPERMAHFLTRKARDRRFDALVKKAIEAGKPVDAASIQEITGLYSNGLLKVRSDAIARTETTQATSAARQEAMQQTLDAAGLTDADVERAWRATKDRRTRDTHAAMNGQKVIGMHTSYVSPSGARLQCPGDRKAPASEWMSCRCYESFRLIRRKSWGV